MQDSTIEPPEMSARTANNRIRAASMMHEDNCFYCQQTSDAQLIYCSFCPKAYHRDCLPEGTVISFPRWGCPSHKCQVPDCGASSSKSRRKIYRCAYCPSSYCFAHLGEGTTILDYNPWQSIGYRTGSFVFIVCANCTHLHQDQSHDPAAQANSTPVESPVDGYKRRNKRKAREVSSDEDEPQIRTAADPALVNEIKTSLKLLGKMQREVARDIGVSEGILSQYMNGATRSNGWRSIETKLNEWLDKSSPVTGVNLCVAPVSPVNNTAAMQLSSDTTGPRLKRRKLTSSADHVLADDERSSSPTREAGVAVPQRLVPLDQGSMALNLHQLSVTMPAASQPMTIHNHAWINNTNINNVSGQSLTPVDSEEVASSYELQELQFYSSYSYEYMSPSALDLYAELTDDNVKQIVRNSYIAMDSIPYYNNNNNVSNEWAHSPFAV